MLCAAEWFLWAAHLEPNNVDDSELTKELRELRALESMSLSLVEQLVHYLVRQCGHPVGEHERSRSQVDRIILT